jgi:hypothetical protein
MSVFAVDPWEEPSEEPWDDWPLPIIKTKKIWLLIIFTKKSTLKVGF